MLLMVVDAALAAGVFALSLGIRFGLDSAQWNPFLPDPIVVTSGYAAGWVLVMGSNGLYRPRARWTIRAEGLAIVKATLMMAVLTFAALFLLKLGDVSRLLLVVLFPIQGALTLASRILLRVGFRWLRSHGYNTRYVLIVGAGPRGQSFANRLESHRELGLEIVGLVDEDPSVLAGSGRTYLGRFADIEQLLRDRVIDEVAICLPFSQWDRIDEISFVCESQGKIVRVPMDLLDHAFAAGRIEELDGIPIYSMVTGPDRLLALATKRLIDIAVSAFGLLLTSPLLGAIALSIALREGRPILFRQERVGLHGRRFNVLKFRTMTIDAEQRLDGLTQQNEARGPIFKIRDDPRVTRTGRVLRRTSLDELPQLWNV
jgi:hypothetical protein